MEKVGKWDFDAGKFYSYKVEGAQQLSQEDLNSLTSEFETSHAFNLIEFAQKRQSNLNTMKMLVFEFCGEHDIHGRVETTPNGDYIVFPSTAITGDFVRQLDQFIQQVLSAETTGAGKKVGGKEP